MNNKFIYAASLSLTILFSGCSFSDSISTKTNVPSNSTNQFAKEDQVSCALSYLAYIGEEYKGSKDSVEKRIFTSITNAIPRVPVLLDQNKKPDWKIVWGPAIQFFNENNDQENLMFVAQQVSQPENYQVIIRGTNFHSLISWFKDINVIGHSDFPTLDNGYGGQISDGTMDNLEDLTSIAPLFPSTYQHKKLNDFLTLMARRKINVTFSGHSLGGNMAPTLALYFAQDQGKSKSWDPNSNVSIKVCSFAGPTSGNQKYADYFETIIPDSTFHRYVNKNDVIPRGFNIVEFDGLESIYANTDVAPMTEAEVAGYNALYDPLYAEAHHYFDDFVYEHTGEKISFMFPVNIKAAGGKSYYDQVDYQHITSYPVRLGVPEVLKILSKQ